MPMDKAKEANESSLSDHDKETLKKLSKYEKEASEYRKTKEDEDNGWVDAERFYEGQQWKHDKKRPVKNWCYTIVESEVPILTDSRPSTDIIPMELENSEDAKMLESAMHFVYDQQNLQLKVSQAVRSALKIGTGYLYVDFDPDMENGEGQILIKNMPWRHVFLDPSSSSIEESNYCILKVPTRLEEVKRRFPKKAKDLKAQNVKVDNFGNISQEYLDPERWHPDTAFDQNQGKKYNLEDMVIVEEYWYKDYSMEDIPEEVTTTEIAKEANEFVQAIAPDVGKFENHEEHIQAHEELKFQLASEALQLPLDQVTEEDIEVLKQDPELSIIFEIIDDHIESHNVLKEQNEQAKRPKYINNWRLTVKVGSTILYDGLPPVRNGKIPLVPIYAYKDENSIYGFGEIKNLIPIQKSYNEMDYNELQGLRLSTNGGWVLDDESGVDETTLTNEPGIVVKKKMGTEVQRLQPGAVSSQLLTRKQDDKAAIEAISGVTEATQGRRPTGITAASAIRFLQEQSIGRIRLKTRYLEEYSMLLLGDIVTSYIIKYWNIEKKLRVYDNNGQIKYVNFSPERAKDLRYEVKTVPGSTSGLDKESLFNVMGELLKIGAIDQRTFFEVTDVPYKNHILRKLDEADETAALIEQLQSENEQLKAQVGVAPSEEELAAVGATPDEIAQLAGSQ